MSRTIQGKTAKTYRILVRMEPDIANHLIKKHGSIAKWVNDTVYSIPKFKKRSPAQIKKQKTRNRIKELEISLKEY